MVEHFQTAVFNFKSNPSSGGLCKGQRALLVQLVPSVFLFQIDNFQSLMQCSGVLVCVGCEPSHSSILENFRKTSNDKLPKLNSKSRSSGCNDGNEGTHASLKKSYMMNSVNSSV